MRARWWRAAGAAAIVAACGGGASIEKPVVAVAASPEAQAAFQPLREHWDDRQRLPLEELRLRVVAFRARFSSDPLAPVARLYLALAYLEAGDLPRGRAELPPLAGVPNGTTRDLAAIAHAKALRMGGDAAAALELLRPRLGKVVDEPTRALFGEELVRAAVALGRDYEAIAYIDSWLRSVDDERRPAVREKATRILDDVAPPALLGALQAMRARGSAVGYSADTERLLVARLGDVALDRQDSSLARWLFSGDGGAPQGPRTSPAGEALTELASSRRGLNEVVGRTLGLVLPTSEPSLQDEAAEVMRGVAWAAGLSQVGDDLVRLVTREASSEPSRLVTRLDELAGEGAAAIITGLDPAAADTALGWAELHHVPVLVLTPPRRVEPGRYGFVVGESLETQLRMLGEALAQRHLTRIAVIRERAEDLTAPDLAAFSAASFATPAACGGSPELLVATRYPFGTWRKERVEAWLFDAPVDCAFGLARALRTERLPGRHAALTLQAATAVQRPSPLTLLALTAGLIPRFPDAVGADPLAEVVQRLGRRPDFWTGLGHDAAALVTAALGPLPLDRTASPEAVAARRDQAREGLERATASLWTTEARGFGGAHRLARTLEVREVKPR